MLGMAHHLKGNLAAAHRNLIVVRDAQLGASAVMNFYGFHRAAEVLIARTLWFLGFPDQAAQAERDANSEDAHKDPITACLVLTWGVSVHYLRGDWATTDDYVERLLAIASEHGFLPYKWFAMAIRGDAPAPTWRHVGDMSNLQEYLRRLREGRYEIYTRWLTCCLAEALADNQRAEQAWRLLNDFNPDPDPKSDVYMPEFLRLRGDDPGAGRRDGCRGSGVSSLARHGRCAGRAVLAIAHGVESGRVCVSSRGACRKPESCWPTHMGGSRKASKRSTFERHAR